MPLFHAANYDDDDKDSDSGSGSRRKKSKTNFNTPLTDRSDISEIKKIADRLDEDEVVLVVARQSRVKPGGSLTTPSIIFATDRRLIIRDPSSLGLRQSIEEISYDRITSARLDEGLLSSNIILRAPGLSTIAEKKLDSSIKTANMGQDRNEGQIEAIPKDKARKILDAINHGIQRASRPYPYVPPPTSPPPSFVATAPDNGAITTDPRTATSSATMIDKQASLSSSSVADELTKLVRLREQGVLSESEFLQMKQNLLDRAVKEKKG